MSEKLHEASNGRLVKIITFPAVVDSNGDELSGGSYPAKANKDFTENGHVLHFVWQHFGDRSESWIVEENAEGCVQRMFNVKYLEAVVFADEDTSERPTYAEAITERDALKAALVGARAATESIRAADRASLSSASRAAERCERLTKEYTDWLEKTDALLASMEASADDS